MLWNIPIAAPARGLILASLLLSSNPVAAQAPCGPEADSVLQSGWRAYRADSLSAAIRRFNQAQQLCPENLDAQVGLGFGYLRQARLREADSLFRNVLARHPNNADAWEGQAHSSIRLGDTAGGLAAARRALALAPNKRELRSFLNQTVPDWDRVPKAGQRAATLQLVARTRGRSFEVRTPEGWKPFYLKGVNFGVALPGKYPSEFPADSQTYAGWLDTLAGMNANAVRLYTALPPAFYRAVRAWNLSHPARPLWLVHGVWTELPPHHDFDDQGWKAGFQAEMRKVVDLVHGSARVPARRGHASGSYDADVSAWVLAYIIGREWEPFAVQAFDTTRGPGSYQGRYLQVQHAPAMDLWLAQQCDLMLQYEADRYNALRPIAYTNWPTLDPLQHPTEASTTEEARWRQASGRRTESNRLEYENDVIDLDPNLVEPTAANPAGWFASYHAYPYYPDFMILDPGYRKARSSFGPSSYYGYLQELITYHRRMPTVIAEYGVPSSRGVAHLHPQGWSHGGHDERAMAAIDARLTREIEEAGAAGSILFAWLDEWFKKNWAVMDYEIPPDNTRQWHNLMDAEQHYGILGQYSGAAATTPTLGGRPAQWRALPMVQPGVPRGSLRGLRLGRDESFLYAAIELAPGRLGWDTLGVQIAIDTYQPGTGQHQLPRTLVRSDIGFEFLIDLGSPEEGSLRVTPEYNRHSAELDPATGDDFGRFARRPVASRNRLDGRFDTMYVITNRARFGRDGTFYRAQRYDRGGLRYGTQAASTLSDWYIDETAGLLEVRIPWDLLNVTDPSTRTLLWDLRTEGAYGTVKAGDFHLGVVLYRRDRPIVLDAVPAVREGRWVAQTFTPWRWEGWSKPRHHAGLKPVYDSLRLLWRESSDAEPAPLGRRAPSN